MLSLTEEVSQKLGFGYKLQQYLESIFALNLITTLPSSIKSPNVCCQVIQIRLGKKNGNLFRNWR